MSSSEIVLPAKETVFAGDIATDLRVLNEGDALDVHLSLEGIHLNITSNYPHEHLGDLLDPTYYDVADIHGHVVVDLFRVSSIHDHIEVTYRYPDVNFDFYVHAGALYFDFSSIDFSDIGLTAGKYYTPDAFSVLADENIATLADLLSSLSLDMNVLLGASEESEELDKAISLSRVDDTRLRLSLDLSNNTLAHLVHYVTGVTSVEDAEASINKAVTIHENSSLSILFDAEKETMDSLGFHIILNPVFDPVEYDGVSFTSDGASAELSGTMSSHPCEKFELPSFDDYELLEFNQSEETQESSN